MYRTLANPKLFCSLSHRCIVLNNIFGDIHRSLLYIAFHKITPAILVFTLYAEVYFVIHIFLSVEIPLPLYCACYQTLLYLTAEKCIDNNRGQSGNYHACSD